MTKQPRVKERVVKMSDVHRAPGKVFKDVARSKEPVAVESGGLLIARIVPYDEQAAEVAEGLRLLDELVDEIGPRAKALGLTEEQVVEKLRQTRKKLSQQKYGKAAKTKT